MALFLLILSASIGCDQISKEAARNVFADSPPLSLAGDTVRFELAENSGAFLSLGAQLPESVRGALFTVAMPVFLLLISALVLHQGMTGLSAVGLALLLGGGLGNWIDRLTNQGLVTDFVSLGLGPVRTGIFNLADVAILAGATMVALAPHLAERRGATRAE